MSVQFLLVKSPQRRPSGDCNVVYVCAKQPGITLGHCGQEACTAEGSIRKHSSARLLSHSCRTQACLTAPVTQVAQAACDILDFEKTVAHQIWETVDILHIHCWLAQAGHLPECARFLDYKAMLTSLKPNMTDCQMKGMTSIGKF